jgi:CopG family nickel-responsive transcriptional regulator
MRRTTITLDEDLVAQLDDFMRARGYANRSEAIRDLIRNALVEEAWVSSDEEMVGTVTIVYDHHTRDLSDKLTEQQHSHHDLIISAMHVHLDHHNCLETIAVRGKARELKDLADQLISIKGVKHGELVMTAKR